MSAKLWCVVFLVSIALSFLLYGNTIKGEFVIDDSFFTTRVELRDPSYLPQIWFESVLPKHKEAALYRPLSVFTISLNRIFFGPLPPSFHVVNIVLNGLVIFFFYALSLRLFKNKILAAFCAIFYAFLPIHTEAVAYIKAREEILGTLFFVLSWLAFLKATANEKINYAFLVLSSFLFFLGLLSKEFVILAPFVFLGTFWIQKKPKIPKLLKKALAVGLILTPFLVTYFIMRWIALDGLRFGSDDIEFIANPLKYSPWMVGFWTSFKIAFIYFLKIFLPYNLSTSYHYNQITLVNNPFFSIEAIVGVLLLASLVFFAVFKKTRASLGIGALTILILYFPVSQIIFRGGDIVGERWMYLPTVGIALIIGNLFYYIYKKDKVVSVLLFSSIMLIFGFLTIVRNNDWTTKISLYKSTAKASPNSVKAHTNLGFEYFTKGDVDNAKIELAAARKISDSFPGVYDLGAIIAYKEKDFDEVQRLLEKSLSRNKIEDLRAPDINLMYLSRAYFIRGYYKEAKYALEFVLEMTEEGQWPQDKILYAVTLTKLHKYEESIEYVEKNLIREMNMSQVRIVMAVNLWRTGKKIEARKYFDFVNDRTDEEKIKLINKF